MPSLKISNYIYLAISCCPMVYMLEGMQEYLGRTRMGIPEAEREIMLA
jgi:hypothetical protein